MLSAWKRHLWKGSRTLGFVLTLIIIFTGFSRLWRLSTPSEYYFDEVYHAVTAKLVAQNDARAYEWWNPAPEENTAVDWLHPPFAKLMQATSMLVFGENSFGWRFSSVVFGTFSVFLVYVLAREFSFDTATSVLAAGLFSLSGLALSMSRIAMNDIHVTFFIILSVWLYWRWRKQQTFTQAALVILATGLAVASKWTGIFLLGLYIFDHICTLIQQYISRHRQSVRPLLLFWSLAFVGIPSIYLLSYGHMFLQGKDLAHWWELHQQIWWYQTNLEATHPYQSTPWQWILNMRPVYAFTSSTGESLQNIYLQENVALVWFGLLAVIWTLLDIFMFGIKTLQYTWQAALTEQKKWFTLLKNHWKTSPLIYRQLFLLAAYGIFWLPWVVSPRIMFFYHYLPSIPFLCILLADQLMFVRSKVRFGAPIFLGIVGLIACTFLLFYPNWTALPVPIEGWSKLYFWTPSWR